MRSVSTSGLSASYTISQVTDFCPTPAHKSLLLSYIHHEAFSAASIMTRLSCDVAFVQYRPTSVNNIHWQCHIKEAGRGLSCPVQWSSISGWSRVTKNMAPAYSIWGQYTVCGPTVVIKPSWGSLFSEDAKPSCHYGTGLYGNPTIIPLSPSNYVSGQIGFLSSPRVRAKWVNTHTHANTITWRVWSHTDLADPTQTQRSTAFLDRVFNVPSLSDFHFLSYLALIMCFMLRLFHP